MAKLYWRYGVMGSGKSAQVAIVAHNYRQVGQPTLLIKPRLDSRSAAIASRIGQLAVDADVICDPGDDLYQVIETRRRGVSTGGSGPDVATVPSSLPATDGSRLAAVIVDEAQFLTAAQIDQLFLVAVELDVPVLCYGLRADYRGDLWPATARLFALAHDICELKMVCHCGRKAMFTHRLPGADTGELVVMGGSEAYDALCAEHFLAEAIYHHSLSDALATEGLPKGTSVAADS
ncbi:MAG: thymidine kinase [Propionibacteriaceae bacterium]|jgi:thymidine kinase|nr:thymidine kinase [Propionibacteriaceae bacterium]